MQITFIGATGMLGQPVARALHRAGHAVKALVRDPEKARGLLPEGIELVTGDLRQVAGLESALRGSDAVYLNLSVHPSSREKDFQPEREGLSNLLTEAQHQGIGRIAYLSSLVQQYQGRDGFDWWVFRLKNEAVTRIKATGLPYFLFYPSTFMENFDQGNYRQGPRIVLAGKSKYPMHFIAGQDYAQQVVQAFAQFEAGHHEFVVQGPEAYLADQAARLYLQHSPERLRLAQAPLGVLKLMGKLSPTFSYGAHIVEALNRYPETFQAEQTWAQLGQPPTTLAQYARGLRGQSQG